jgi:hypothetical protein
VHKLIVKGVGSQENLEIYLKFMSNKGTINKTAKGASFFSKLGVQFISRPLGRFQGCGDIPWQMK